MKLYAPSYYSQFTCIADRCRHSCCIGWEIDVDGDTLQKYAALNTPFGKELLQSIDRADTPHFRLAASERCPHLDERGLCRIIKSLGEGYLCDICREHPRFYHETAHGMEVGLGMACEEACRLILTSDSYDTFTEQGDVSGDPYPTAFDATAERAHIYAVLKNEALPYPARLQAVAAKYDLSLSCRTDTEWRALLASLEYLNDAHLPLFAAYTTAATPDAATHKALERALAYFVLRHCSATEDITEFRAALGFSLLCERVLASMIAANACDPLEAARILSEELEYSEENTEAIKQAFAQ